MSLIPRPVSSIFLPDNTRPTPARQYNNAHGRERRTAKPIDKPAGAEYLYSFTLAS